MTIADLRLLLLSYPSDMSIQIERRVAYSGVILEPLLRVYEEDRELIFTALEPC